MAGAEPPRLSSAYAQPFSVQFVALMKRALCEYWRNPGYNAVRCVFCTVLGLLLGSIYYQVRGVGGESLRRQGGREGS